MVKKTQKMTNHTTLADPQTSHTLMTLGYSCLKATVSNPVPVSKIDRI